MDIRQDAGLSRTHERDQGLLIVFEGSDGAGKTTQRKLFKTWLQNNREAVAVTKWNSSPLFKPVMKARKAARSLTPIEFAVLQAADFRHRFHTEIEPALNEGKIVLADRYVFTGIARDVARGLDRGWSMSLYEPIRWPDLVFYFSATPQTCAARIMAAREIKYYEAGQDVTGLSDPVESYIRFATKVMDEYGRLSQEFSFITVDAERSIYEQHRFIRDAYGEKCGSRFDLTSDVGFRSIRSADPRERGV
jgi:dTMP kinase